MEEQDVKALGAVDGAADTLAALEATTTIEGEERPRVLWRVTVALSLLVSAAPVVWALLVSRGAESRSAGTEGQGLVLMIAGAVLYVVSAGLVLPASRVRDGRTAVLASAFALAAGFDVVATASSLGGDATIPLVWLALGALAANSGVLVVSDRRFGPVVSFVVRNRWSVLGTCLAPAVAALLVAVLGVEAGTLAVPFTVSIGLVALVLGGSAAWTGLRIPEARRDRAHALLAVASAACAGAAGVTVVGTQDRLAAEVSGLVICAVGLIVCGWMAIGYAGGRRVTMAIEGIFEWAPQSDADEHLSEAAEALLRAADAAHEGPSHNRRVIQMAVGTAQELDLPPGRLRVIVLGALFHDVGTLAIPDEILNKPGALTDSERELVESHVETGYAMASRVHLLWEAALAVRHHHEWWDGSGYPDGLAGSEIPIEARVIAVADMFDALTTARPYRSALSDDEALLMMRAEAGTHLDPEVFAAFARHAKGNDNVVPLQSR